MDEIKRVLEVIKSNDGFPGILSENTRAVLVNKKYAVPEVSPITGLDVRWSLAPEGKAYLRRSRAISRDRRLGKERFKQRLYPQHQREAVVPLTIEVLDALKAIREHGDPRTTKLEVLARIQRHGQHAAKTIKGAEGKDIVVSGALATCKDGEWSLTDAGKRIEAGHIRKGACAQFTGKVI